MKLTEAKILRVNLANGNISTESISQDLLKSYFGGRGVASKILADEIEKVVVNGKTTYDFQIFRHGKKHIVGMYDEINSFVSYVKDAAEGGSSKEMAYVLVGEPGNGKTFFVEFVSKLYRQFLKPGDAPEAVFETDASQVSARLDGRYSSEVMPGPGCNSALLLNSKWSIFSAQLEHCWINYAEPSAAGQTLMRRSLWR